MEKPCAAKVDLELRGVEKVKFAHFSPENLVQPEIKVYLGWSMGKNHPSDPVHVAGEEFQSSTQVAPAGNLRHAVFLTSTPISGTEKENNK